MLKNKFIQIDSSGDIKEMFLEFCKSVMGCEPNEVVEDVKKIHKEAFRNWTRQSKEVSADDLITTLDLYEIKFKFRIEYGIEEKPKRDVVPQEEPVVDKMQQEIEAQKTEIKQSIDDDLPSF